jgi:hypothetical protein
MTCPPSNRFWRARGRTHGRNFPQYWTYHLAREHERLYPTPDQAHRHLVGALRT